MKKTIEDVSLKGVKVLLRVDFNVPIDEHGNITDDKRILAALPTIRYISKQGAKLIICSHLGRPEGKRNMDFTMLPVAKRLIEIMHNKVFFATDVVGKDAMSKAAALKNGEILVLENVRFEDGEEKNDPDFTRKLASMAEFFVNDAFGTAHRKHASTYGVAKLLPNAVGFLMGKEVNVITTALNKPRHPFVGVVGGAKIKDKIAMIKNLLNRVDVLLLGGGMSMTFLKAKGYAIGKSLVDEGSVEVAKEILEYDKKNGKKIILPTDVLCAKFFEAREKARKFSVKKIKPEYMALDIGPKTRRKFSAIITEAKTAIWNGPMGVFEFANFKKGTIAVAEAFSNCGGMTIVGGGESGAAMKELGLDKSITHLSTGGGASLMLFEGASLPCVDAIAEKEKE